MDNEGYPTDEELQTIKDWKGSDGRGLLEYVSNIWHWPDRVWIQDDLVCFSTGGWSGNEELISTMGENFLFWSIHWDSSARGGLHKFRVHGWDETKIEDTELVDLRRVVSQHAKTYDALVQRAQKAESAFKLFYDLAEESFPYVSNDNALANGSGAGEHEKQRDLTDRLEKALKVHKE